MDGRVKRKTIGYHNNMPFGFWPFAYVFTLTEIKIRIKKNDKDKDNDGDEDDTYMIHDT
jgi:hypothetical protein